jgi:type I restriction enzyme R subunit
VRNASGIVAESVTPYTVNSNRNNVVSGAPNLGMADYVLMDRRGRPLAVVEAKRTAVEPYAAKQQALPRERDWAPFIF